MANSDVQVLGNGQVKLPNGDVWKGMKTVERADTLAAPTDAERVTNPELTEAALAMAALTVKPKE